MSRPEGRRGHEGHLGAESAQRHCAGTVHDVSSHRGRHRQLLPSELDLLTELVSSRLAASPSVQDPPSLAATTQAELTVLTADIARRHADIQGLPSDEGFQLPKQGLEQDDQPIIDSPRRPRKHLPDGRNGQL